MALYELIVNGLLEIEVCVRWFIGKKSHFLPELVKCFLLSVLVKLVHDSERISDLLSEKVGTENNISYDHGKSIGFNYY